MIDMACWALRPGGGAFTNIVPPFASRNNATNTDRFDPQAIYIKYTHVDKVGKWLDNTHLNDQGHHFKSQQCCGEALDVLKLQHHSNPQHG